MIENNKNSSIQIFQSNENNNENKDKDLIEEGIRQTSSFMKLTIENYADAKIFWLNIIKITLNKNKYFLFRLLIIFIL